jgi:hypothetical protein
MYNESKVKTGAAEIFGTRNVHFDPVNPAQKIDLLEYLANFNYRVKNKSTHLILSFSQKDELTKAKMQSIVGDYMEALGFGDQPAFIYLHKDTDNPHLHIVTTPVEAGGYKIDTAFIKNRSNRIRQDLEKKYDLVVAEDQKKNHDISQTEKGSRQYKQIKLKQAIEDLKFSSLGAYFDYMQVLGIYVEPNYYIKNGTKQVGLMYQFDSDCKPIKASNLYMKPTAKRIEKRVSKPVNKQLNGQYDRILAFPAEDIYLIVNDREGSVTKAEDIGLSKQVLKDIYLKSLEKPKVENTIIPETSSDANAKKIATLISRMYQTFKKEQRIYYESTLIDKFPHELFVEKLSKDYHLPAQIAKQSVDSFFNYKRSQYASILDKECSYFANQAYNKIAFVNKMPIDEYSKHTILYKLGVIVSQDTREVEATESSRVGFTIPGNSIILENSNESRRIPQIMNKASDEFMKKWFEQESPPFAGPEIDHNIVELLKDMGYIKKKEPHEELGISKEHFDHLVSLLPSRYEQDQEKFLRESNVNRVRQMRRGR